MTCKARQHSDQMQCGRCGLAWDVNDPESPACRPVARVDYGVPRPSPAFRQQVRAQLEALRQSLQK